MWLLLHYEDIQHPMHRDEVMRRLKICIPNYNKGARGAFATTSGRLDIATARAKVLVAKSNAYSDPEPFTSIEELVTLLTTLRK
ncbi:Hypothetical protein HDN1F_13030 [gamma proteobacterium HdN1]|nr:Hypothetical protein HDN1F_13030 [gamma proteobacterium HdN1]